MANKCKNFICLTMVFTLLFSFGNLTATAAGVSMEFSDNIEGLYFGPSSSAVASEENSIPEFELETMQFSDNTVSMCGTVSCNSERIPVDTVGIIYQSVVTEDAIVAVFEEANEYKVISFVVEFSPKEELLLPATKDIIKERSYIGAEPVIKIAFSLVETGEIVYFENVLHGLSANTFTATKICNDSDDLKDLLYSNERWFFDAFSDKSEVVEVSVGKGLALIDELELLAANSNGIARGGVGSGTVIPAIDDSLFKTIGINYLTGYDTCGFYMNTIEWPVGTNNKASDVISWELVTPSTIRRDSDLPMEIEILYSGEYYYDASTDTISLLSSYTPYSLKDVSVSATVSECGDIITKKVATQQYSSVNYTTAFMTILGKFPVTSKLATPINILRSLTPTKITSSNDAYEDTLEKCKSVYGMTDNIPNAVRFAGNATPSGKKLTDIGDKIYLEITILKPSDASSYYTYITGTKTLSIVFEFSVYQGSTALLSEKSRTINVNYT